MTLTRPQQLWLLASDGLASADELAELAASGMDADWEPMGEQLAMALAPDELPDLADQVMARLGMTDTLGLNLRQALDAGDAPDLSDDIMAALGLQDELGPSLRQALDAGDAPDLSGDIMAALGLSTEDDADLEQDFAPIIPLRPALTPAVQANRGGWGFSALAAAAAAALLVLFTGPLSSSQDPALAFVLSPINHVDIEELSAGDEVMVQVIQQDDNAPTIIFIDELDPSSPDAGGTSL